MSVTEQADGTTFRQYPSTVSCMDPAVKVQWIDALTNGKYEQATSFLVRKSPEGKESFCCLGVLRDIMEPGFRAPFEAASVLGVKHSAGLTDMQMSALARMNDNGKSFAEIAEYIKNNL